MILNEFSKRSHKKLDQFIHHIEANILSNILYPVVCYGDIDHRTGFNIMLN